MPGRVSPEEAKRLVANGARLIDVRTPAEFAEKHIPGAKNIPIGELDHRLAELEPKDAPVVLYCRSGSRSSSGVRLLEKRGFTRIYNLGAMSQWR